MKNYISSTVIAVVVVALAFVFISPKTTVVQTQPLGASGATQTAHAFFLDNLTVGGYDFATSSQGTVTLTAASVVNSRVIEDIATAAQTLTLPTNAALSSAGFLPNVGDTQVLFIHASTTKATIAGNTNVTVSSASTTKDISNGHVGRLEFVRLGATENRGIWVNLTSD